MAEKKIVARARRAKRQGKSPSTQAGEFVREEIHHVRQGEHGARSAKQAIAIGLSKARRAGVKLGVPQRGSEKVRRQATRELHEGPVRRKPSRTRSRAVTRALQKEGTRSASHTSIARHSRRVARLRGPRARHEAAEKAVSTKGKTGLRRAARKAARTRERHRG